MRIVSMSVILVGVFASGWSSVLSGQTTGDRAVPGAARSRAVESSAASQVVGTYCGGCHNGVMRSPSGALLDRFDTDAIAESPDVWTRAYRQLQAGTMPPVGASRPGQPAYDAVLASIEAALGANAAPAADATSQEIADRLALLLWNSAPDPSLLQDAQRNRLTSAATLDRQIKRMLQDERAHAFVERFFFPWLGLDQLGKAEPNRTRYPEYDVSLRDAMSKETELFLLSQLREDRDPIELWNANYTFLNDQLARHYAIPGITGAQFRRVALSMPERAGLLGQGSILTGISRHQPGQDVKYTSPASRAIWVRAHFLGATPPRPVANAQPVKPELPITPQTRTLPAEPCVNCHRNFFPLGYALENFDPIGRWRTDDQYGPVDASGSFVDGTPTNGIVELRRVLLQHPDAFRTTITEKLLDYASAKSPSASLMAAPDTLIRARQILRRATPTRWSSIIAAMVSEKPQKDAARPAVFAESQAAAGRAAYESVCVNCHTSALTGRTGEPGELPAIGSLAENFQKDIRQARGIIPPLAGDAFMKRWGGRTTQALSQRIATAISGFPPAGLDGNTANNLTAYFLSVSGARPGAQELGTPGTMDVLIRDVTAGGAAR